MESNMLPEPDAELIQYFKKGLMDDDGNYIGAWDTLKKIGGTLRRLLPGCKRTGRGMDGGSRPRVD